MKLARIGAVVALLAAAVALGAAVRPGSAHGSAAQPTEGDGITVSGTGTGRAAPDQATFFFGVQTEGASAKAALDANSAKMALVIAAIKRAGVAEKDVQTQDVSVMPRQDETGQISGYFANNSVQALVRKLAGAGAVVDAVVAAGANQSSGPSFDQSRRDVVYRAALRAAVADARTKAEALAAESNASLGRVMRIVEGFAAEPVPMYGRALADSAKASTPIEPGTQEVQATVTVTFELS
jgi:uncharacterized protein YggE